MTRPMRPVLFGLLLSALHWHTERRCRNTYFYLSVTDGVQSCGSFADICEKVGTDTGERSLLFPTFPVMTQVCTRSASHLITCSSAAATALATGEKTTNYVIL